ncbi:hypothetical protein ACET3Z_023994 [Daucus carota]
MIMGHSKTSNLEMGVSVYAQMRSLGISPNARTFPFLAKACENVHSLGQIYGQAVKFGHCGDVYVVSSFINVYALIGEVGLAVRVFDGSLDRNVVCYTSLISGFCRNGYVDCAREVFDAMTERNDVCCSAMVSGYISNEKYSEGIGLFRELRECGNVRFNKSILMSVLSACAAVGAYEEGVRVHCYVRENHSPVAGSTYVGLKPNPAKLFVMKDSVTWKKKTVSNGSKTHCMKVWNPIDNKKFETLSYLPPLTDESIAREIDYMMKKGWVPCLEFDALGYVYRENSRIPNYYDGRYWTLWKLPMFGCTDASQVLHEIAECKKAYPTAFIRCLAFDNIRQAQCMSFVIQKPATTS